MGLFEYWPYSNFHELNADWLLNRVKQMSDYLNNLPDLVQDWINEGLSDIDINQKILDAMTQFGMAINVVAPPNDLEPAKPDGSEEATATIQGCIDYAYAQGGGVVFFPAGRYLTGPLTLKSNVILMGFGRATTKIALRGGSIAPLISSNGSNMGIFGLTLDGNAEVQTEDLTLVSMMGTDVDYDGLELTGGHILLSHNITGGHCYIHDVIFNTCVQHAAMLSGTGELRLIDCVFNNLSAVGGISVIQNDVDGAKLDFTIKATAPTGLVLNGNKCFVECDIATSVTTPVDDNGTENNVKVYNVFVRMNTDNMDVNVPGDLTINAGDVTETVNNHEIVASEKVEISGTDVVLNPTNPLTYKAPSVLDKFFKYITFKNANTNYNVLVAGDYLNYISNAINVKSYGCVGDAITDDTDNLKSAINAGSVIYIPKGTYNIRNSEISISNKILIADCGAILQVIANNETNYYGISISENSVIYNISVYGDRSAHIGTSGEWGHAVQIETGSNCYLYNVSAKNAWGDGFYIGNGDGDAVTAFLDNCIADNNRRNGFSIINANPVYLTNCKAINTNGTNPQFGIDVEPNTSGQYCNVLIDNYYSYNNKGGALLMAITTTGISGNCVVNNVISDHDGTDNTFIEGAVEFRSNAPAIVSNSLVINNIIINECKRPAIGYYTSYNNGHVFKIKNGIIVNHNFTSITLLKNSGTRNVEGPVLEYDIIYPHSATDNDIVVVNSGTGKFINTIVKRDRIGETTTDIIPDGNYIYTNDGIQELFQGIVKITNAGVVTYTSIPGVTCQVSDNTYTIVLPSSAGNRITFIAQNNGNKILTPKISYNDNTITLEFYDNTNTKQAPDEIRGYFKVSAVDDYNNEYGFYRK